MANLRFALLLLAFLDCSPAVAATQCPLPGGACLPAHGHPVLETKINQLREEFQRHADRSDAQVQKLQADVAANGARLGDLSKRVDDLALQLDGLKDKASKQDNRWLEILLSGVFGSILATGLTLWLQDRYRRADLSMAFFNRFHELADKRAGVEAILDPRSGVDLSVPSTRNDLINLGNWYETVAEAYQRGRVDRRALWDLGLVQEAQRFVGAIAALATQREATDRQLAQELNGMVAEWKFLGQLKTLSRPAESLFKRQ